MTDLGLLPLRLVYLLVVLIDFLKIDRSFIVGLGEDQGDEAIVSGTVGLAHALGVIAVAEGVETSDQAAILKGTGVRPGSRLLLRQTPSQRSCREAAGRRHLLLAALGFEPSLTDSEVDSHEPEKESQVCSNRAATQANKLKC